MYSISYFGDILNGKVIPNEKGIYPAYGGNGIISYVNKWNYPENTIIIGRVGANCGAVHFSPTKCWVTDNALAFNVNSKNNPYFVYYFLKLINLNRFHIGSSQPLITQSIIKNISYSYVLDLEMQTCIANMLNVLDKKISINNKINIELQSMTKTLYDYWFLQFEFSNEEGKPYKSSGGKMVWNEELKQEVPEGWKVKQIKKIIKEAQKSKIQVNEAKEKGLYPFFTSGQSTLAFDEYLIDGFNIFLNTGGNPDVKAYSGKCAYSTDTWCVSAGTYSYILYYYFCKILPQFEQLFFEGSGLKHLQKNALKNNVLLIPSQFVLDKFNIICGYTWNKITNNIKQNTELSSLRDFLLPLLINGQVTFEKL